MFDSTLTRARPPSRDAWGPGITLAVLVHIALVVALAFGVSWRSSEPAGIEAELWAAVPQTAAPKLPTPPKPVEPTPVVPKVEPPPPPPVKAVEPPPPNEAEIAIEKARQGKLLRDQQEAQRQREEETKRRQAEELKKKQAAEREEARRRDEEEQRQARQREQEEQQAARLREQEERRLAQQREQNLKNLLAQVGGTGAPGSTGSAARSAGPSAGYAGRIAAKVRPNILFGDEIAGNPAALVEVRAAPDGTITSRRLVRSSGVKAWDDAVLRAIDRTETLPRDTDGHIPPTIEIDFRPKD